MKRKAAVDPLLKELDEVIAEYREKAAADPVDQEDMVALQNVRDLIADGEYGKAYREWRALDTFVREGVPEGLCDVMQAAAMQKIEHSAKSPSAVYLVIRRGVLDAKIMDLSKQLTKLRSERRKLR